MAKVVQNVNPSVLQWARERKRYHPTEIAGKFGKSINEEVILDWESGKKIPTYPQLEKLADHYKVPIAIFFFPEPPKIEDSALSLRSVPNFNLDLISHTTLDVIHRVQATQMALKEFNDGVNPVPSPIHKKMKLDPSDSSEISVLAETLRRKDFLDVPLDKQLRWGSYRQALEDWRDAIEAKGIFVFRWPFKSEGLSGFCLYDEEFPVICLDSQESKGRQIFTLLHEFAHLLHGENSVTLDKDGVEIHGSDIQESERYFDNLAGSVLVPMDDLKQRFSQSNTNTKDFYIQTAKHYKVSPRMFLVRCRLNNLISYDDFTNVKESLNGNIRDKTEGGGDYYWNYISYWGKAFLHNILSKYHQNRIDEYEMSQVLSMKIKNIEKLEDRLINKQWSEVL